MPRGKEITKDQILSDIKDVSNQLGREDISISDYDKYGTYGSSTVRRKFDTWNTAKEKVNLQTLDSGREENYQKMWQRKLIPEVKRLSEKYLYGQRFTPILFEKSKNFSRSAFENNFDTWEDLENQSGLDYVNKRDYSKGDLVQDIEILHNELGKVPSKKDMNKYGLFSVMPYRKEFGSYGKALEYTGRENTIPKGMNNTVSKTTLDYGNNWETKRKQCLERDNFRCQVCNDNNVVSVHHIKPRYKFIENNNKEKMNDLSNLVTLCRSCHGKLEGKYIECDFEEFTNKGKERLGISKTNNTSKIKESIFLY